MTEFIPTIGLEIHVQLKTKSKMFCRCSSQYFGANPNTHTCSVCLGLPGALPVINKEAINGAIKLSLGLNCQISPVSKFDRKNYFYPDLPKGFQISQFDLPIGTNGFVIVDDQKIRINRAHQEEDTGKLIHSIKNTEKYTLVDFNRSGVPLLEIVSEPDIHSPEQAKNYAKKIHQIARYLDVADGDMEKAGMRFDANVSIAKTGAKTLGTKVEIKNINSFRYLERAVASEIERQLLLIKKGENIVQETRGWVESENKTVSQRSKETSPDYRYFPEPDLPPLVFIDSQISKTKSSLPELPDKKVDRFEKIYKLDRNNAQIIIEDKNLAQWFEEAVSLYAKYQPIEKCAKTISSWIIGEISRILNQKNTNITSIKLEPASLVELLILVDTETINLNTAKSILPKMIDTGMMPKTIVDKENLGQLSSNSELEKIIGFALEENKKAVDDFYSGKESSLGFLVGQVMKKTQGKANPTIVTKILVNKLSDGNTNKN